MLFSKLKTAIKTSVLTWLFSIILISVGGIIYKVTGGDGEISVAIGASFLLIIYFIPAIIIVGIPISVAADQLTVESNHRKLYSLMVHNGLGILIFFVVFSNSDKVDTFNFVVSSSPWLLIVIIMSTLLWRFDEKAKMNVNL